MDLDRHDPRSLPQSCTSKRVVFLDPLEGVRTEEEEVSFLLHFRSSREHKAPEATLSRAPRQHNDHAPTAMVEHSDLLLAPHASSEAHSVLRCACVSFCCSARTC